MLKWFGRILSLLIVATYIAVGTDFGRHITSNSYKGSFMLLLPLALIWFPEPLGDFTGYVGRGGMIDTPTPAWMVAAAGWFLLVGLPVLLVQLNWK